MHTLRELFKKYNAQTSPSPLLLEFTKAEGNYLLTHDGEKYLDLISGIGVSSYGHGNAKVIEAIKKQADAYLHQMVYGEYVQSPQVLLAQKLIALLPSQFEQVYFVNSGAEAVEGVLKLAVRYTGRKKIIAARNAYHGSTTGALGLMSNAYFTEKFTALLNPNVSFIEFNNEESCTAITEETACVIVEPVQGEAGYIPATKSFLEALRKRCDETGTLLIFDEIQSGMGRTGKWFAFEHYGIIPDVLLLAKALGAGMPLGAFISSQKIMQCLSDNPVLGHITTYGGHPVSCAAGLAGIEFLEESKLLKMVEDKTNHFRQGLTNHRIKAISGLGLMLAVEFETEEECKKIIDYGLRNKVISDWFLHAANKLRIAPPLTISENEITNAIFALGLGN